MFLLKRAMVPAAVLAAAMMLFTPENIPAKTQELTIAAYGDEETGHEELETAETPDPVGAGYEIYNKHGQYYSVYAKPVTATLMAAGDGFMTVDRARDAEGNQVLLVRNYDSNFEPTAERLIGAELPLYGGFYASTDAFYYLSGQENPNEDNSAEVFRITKYDRSWNRLGSASLYGANTTVPFDAGSARFAEYGKYLFIRTAHEMYKASDGVNHQANVTIKLDTDSMTVDSYFAGVYNVSNGYISHSFNQFIAVDSSGYVVTLDHGDALPRSAALGRYGTKAESLVFGKSTAFSYSNTMTYAGATGANKTYASLGGLAFSNSNYLTAGNSNRQDGSTDEVRNVYVSVNPRSGFPGTPAIKWLTDYPAGGTITASTPHLVKIDGDTFAVIWEEYMFDGWFLEETLNCRYAFVDGAGNVKSSGSFRGYLSDCVPVVTGNKLCWYVTEYDQTSFYFLGQDGTVSIRGSEIKIDSAENENTGIRLSWAPDQNARYFNVYRRDNTYYESDRGSQWEFLGTTNAKSYLDTTAETGHGYFYTIRAAVHDGDELPRAWDTVGQFVVRVPAPELTSVVSTGAGPKLSWPTTSDGSNYTAYMANRYVIWRKSEDRDWEQIGTAGNGDNTYSLKWFYTDTTAEAGKTYRYTVSAIMSRRGQTFEGPKNETGLSILYLTQPAVTALTADSGGVNVSWTAAPGAESYRVYRMRRSILEFVKEKEREGITASVEWTAAGTTSGTSLRDTEAGCGEWYYIVQAVSGSSESVKDFELSDPHIVFVPEVNITQYGWSQAANRAYFNWMHSSNHSAYAVYRRTDGGEWNLVGKVPVLPAETFYDESPILGAVTEYTVTAFYTDGDGNEHEGFKAEPGVTVDLNKMRFYTVTAEKSTYTGSAITPSFNVVRADDGTVLSGAYYTAEFTENVNAGSGTITVTGKGEYSGVITGKFEIAPKPVAALMIGSIAEQTYNGSSLKPEITVKDGSRTMTDGADYTVSYGENIYPPNGTVTITGMGNYTGSAEKSFVIDGGPILAIRLSEPDISIVYGDTRALPEVTYEPEFASDEKKVDWSSSNENLVTVTGGQIRAVDPGKAVITAAVPGREVSASADVRVLFADVKDPKAWYFDSVYWALDSGVTTGYGKGTFQPTAGLNRAQTVAFLYKMAGSPDVSGLDAQEFTDVKKSDWFYSAVKWAAANKITSGYGSGTFRPNMTCTRAMIVSFLMSYAKLDGTYAEPAEESDFPDVPSTAWYKGAVDWAAASGVTSGYGDGTFRPGATCSRAMMVTFLKKAAELPKV